jgi:flagellar biosynthesis/type III secretory pathway M-ring protein FliF/YscJ
MEFLQNNKRTIILILALAVVAFLVYWFFLRKKSEPQKSELAPLLERTAEMKLTEQVEAIQKDPKWIQDTEAVAAEENNPLEKQVILTAIWILKQDEKLSKEELAYLEQKYS